MINSSSPKNYKNPAFRLTFYYFIFGFLWILISDNLLEWIIGEDEAVSRFQTYKGWFFVLVTGIIFFFIAHSQFRQMTGLNRSLRASHRKLNNLISGYPSGLILVDRETMEISYLNDYSANLAVDWEIFLDSFFETEETVRTTGKLINPDIPERAKEVRFRNKEGRDMYFRINSTPLKDEKGNIIEVLITFDDISSQKKVEEELQKNEELHKILMKNIPNTDIYLFDTDFNILTSGGSELAKLADGSNDHEKQELKRILEPLYRSAIKGFESSEELKVHNRCYSIKTAPVRNINNLIFAGIAILQDITPLRSSEKELREQKSMVEVAVEATKLGFWIANYKTGDNFINNYWAEMIGYGKEEAGEKLDFFYDRIHPEDIETLKDHRIWEKADHDKVVRLNFRMKHKEGYYVWIESVAKILEEDKTGVIRALGTHRDISMEKDKERELFKSLLKGEDQANKKIASELHDGVGQYLTASSLNLEYINKDMSKLNADLRDHYITGMSFLKEAIEEIRNLSVNLMPGSISDFGLIAAIKSLRKRLEKTTSAKILYNDNIEDINFDPETSLNIFRIIQESFNNAIRHSDATVVSLQLLKNGSILTVSIEDNGKGFDIPETKKKTDGLGLKSISNRARALDGSLTIESSPGKGTGIIVEINLE